jgi:hypothetical protein
MRKRMKRKLRSCPMCKPHKMGGAIRWKHKDYVELKTFERDEKFGHDLETVELDAETIERLKAAQEDYAERTQESWRAADRDRIRGLNQALGRRFG